MKALVVVDFQNDFVDGSLGFEKAKELEPIIVEKINNALDNSQDLIFTFDTHGEDYLKTQEGKNLPVPHCIKGTKGHKLYGEVAQYKDKACVCFNKNTFGDINFANYLTGKKYREIEFCGLVSNICVLSNAVLAKAALPQAKIVVDSNATASFDSKLNEECMDILKGLQVEVI